MLRRVVTIDGPAGSGKSTVARLVAERLGYRFLDTGAMFRAVTLAALRAGIDLEDEPSRGALAERLRVELPSDRVLLDGQDVSNEIRGVEVTRAVCHLADSPRVRAQLARWQRAFAAEHDTVTEGRDQGTIVFPDAPCKFFLTADPVERARRRHAEFLQREATVSFDDVLRDLRERDTLDQNRAIAPLRSAPDAETIDTTDLSPEQVADRIVALVQANSSPQPCQSAPA